MLDLIGFSDFSIQNFNRSVIYVAASIDQIN